MKQTLSVLRIILLLPFVLFSQSNEEKEELMLRYFENGYDLIYVQKDSAYGFLEKALKIADEIGDYDSSIGILDHIIITADYHNDLPKYRSTLQQVNTLLSKEDSNLRIQGVEDWQIGYLMWLAFYHFETMEYVKAKELFLKARGRFDEIPKEDLSDLQADWLCNLNTSLGTTYMNLGNYELAEINYLRSIELAKTSEALKENADSYIIGANQSLAQLYTRMGKHEKANAFYIKNLKWSKENFQIDKKFKNNLVNAFQKITVSYLEQDSLNQALHTLEESSPYLLDDPFLNESLVLYGDIYTGLKNYAKALSNYQNALEFILVKTPNQKNQGIAVVHGKIAELYLKQNKYQEGLKTIKKAFNAAGNNIKISHFKQNPDPSEVFSKTQLLNLLDTKLQLLQGSYEETDDDAFEDAILQTSRDVLKTFDLLKSEFDSKLDKQFLAENAYPIFHRLLETVYKEYEKNPSAETLQLALNIAEKNKDFVLLEALRNAQATQYGNVPKKVLDKEAQLRTEITNLEKQLFDATETEGGFSDALFKQKQEYFGFLDSLKSQYPKYHELKYQNKTLELATIREKLLADNGTLISYTMADDYLYAIVINGTKEDFLKLPLSATDREAIRKFYRLLSRPSISAGEKETSEIAHLLFEKILKKPLTAFETENLTIIADGELHYLPFDLLQENGSYLLETKNIGYANSVTSLLELKEKKRAETNKMLAFAPSFSGDVVENADRQFGKLLYNDDEVLKIETFYDTETIIDKRATLKSFTTKISDFNIFHLASHASANDKYPDYSYLAFSESNDSTEGNILYIKDLYNMSLNVDMVTLSACQTGIGKLQKGQGMLSLSKGFYYAGAKSLVNTLWKINDKSTVKLMEYFYEGLSKGYSKSEALRKAKLKYLETTDDELLKHPYYWAAFVVSGDISPISNNNNFWWIIGFGAVSLLLIGFFSKKGKDFKKNKLYN